MKKYILFLIIFICNLFTGMLYAQKRTVTGTVLEGAGVLQGASVYEKDRMDNGTITDANGKFQITLQGKTNILVASYAGYTEKETDVKGKTTVEIKMELDVKGLEKVVVVGFGTKKRITNTGAVSSISGKEIKDIPSSSVQNSLSGRLPGLFTQQRSGQPGKDASEFFIRGVSSLNATGNTPLIIVDDVEYTYAQVAQLDANEIESISILKDASTTAIYGIKGANGVLVITTRRGIIGRPSVSYTTEVGWQAPVIKPGYLDAFQTATLRNEALRNDGIAEDFTAQDLELFRNGQDPYGHPNIDWYSTLFKPSSLQTRNSLDISGGTKQVKYFVSLGYLWQNGLLRDFTTNRSEVNNNYFYQRYNFRSNLDIEATKTLALRLDVSGRLGDVNEPHQPSNIPSEVSSFQSLPPYAYPLINPDGSYPWSRLARSQTPSIIGRIALLGYDRNYSNDFNILFSATQKLSFIEGLSVKGRIAYASTMGYTRTLSRSGIPSFYYNPQNGSYTPEANAFYRIPRFDLTSTSANTYSTKTVNLQGIVDYNRTFGHHHIYSLALYNQNSYINASGTQELVPSNFRGYSFRLGYDFKQKYLVEFNGAYNGTDRFVKSNRYGLFPAASIGWNVAEESFFKKAFPFVDLFKLRASYGIVGSDVVAGGQYLFEQVYENSGTYSFGEVHANYTGIREGSLGNYNITWEKEKKTDIGVDINMFNGKLSLTVDYFNNFRYDQLITRGSVLNILGVALPKVNLGEVRNKGFDGQINYKNQIGKISYNIGGTFSIAKNMVVFQDESQPRYPWLSATGRPLGQAVGYTWIGFYENDADVLNSAKPNLAVFPGDLKYADLNGDGVIDTYDQQPIGKPNLPQTNVGATLGLSYKNFDLSILFQGAFDYSFSGGGLTPFIANFRPIHLERWTPATSSNAKFPRLSTSIIGISSATYLSDFWNLNAYYIRFKSLDLGYRLPLKFVKLLRFSNARAYVSGYNLFTWTVKNMYRQDPETAAGVGYPNQRIINLGLRIGM